MCTLVAFIRVWPGSALVVAANRDERLDRAASGPTRWAGEKFFAPRDEVAGGTWLGSLKTSRPADGAGRPREHPPGHASRAPSAPTFVRHDRDPPRRVGSASYERLYRRRPAGRLALHVLEVQAVESHIVCR